MTLTWSFITKALGLPCERDFPIQRICTDTRALQSGDVFLALVGKNFDGHAFLDQAVAAGAVACIGMQPRDVAAPYLQVADTLKAYAQIAHAWRMRFNLPLVAITGSVGKTSAKHLLAHIFRACGPTLAPQSSFNNEVGVPQTLLQLNETHRYAVIEMGACHKGDIAYLMHCAAPTVGLLTMCAPVHIESFGSLEVIAEEKSSIYRELPPDGIAILNSTEPHAAAWRSMIGTRTCWTFGLDSHADVRAVEIQSDIQGSHFVLQTPKGNASVFLPFPAEHQIMNALGAVAAALAVGCPFDIVASALAHCPPLPGRLRVFRGRSGAQIIDDSYNANPVSVRAAIQVLAQQAGRKILVLGDMTELGPEENTIHQDIGAFARQMGIDALWSMGKRAALAAQSFGSQKQYPTPAALWADLAEELDSESVCLIKGSKVMRMFDIVAAIEKEGSAA